MCDRIVVLIDMDCFYCQVEEKLNPTIKGKPIAVVQYNSWKGGGIIAVNYSARAQGVTRHMRGDQAQQKCPDIVLARVPSKNNKADTTRYREAGKEVADVLQTFTSLLERASVDEAYLDITENVNTWIRNNERKVTKELLFNTYAVGHEDISQFLESVYPDDETLANENSLKLAIGACIANKIRSAVLKETGYECSAGIAHNKTLAKLICGLNKPNKQTLLPQCKIPTLYETLPVTKIRSLGGKFGEQVCTTLNIQYMSELFPFSERQLQQKFNEKYGSWLYNIARGIDYEPVVQRLTSKSIGCCKNFPGRNSIKNVTSLKHWLHELANEVSERLQKDEIENARKAKQLIINFTIEVNKKDISNSRSTRLVSYDSDQITAQSLEVICQSNLNIIDKNSPETILLPIKHLGLHVGKFESKNENGLNIASFFRKVDPNNQEDDKINVFENKDFNISVDNNERIQVSKTKHNSKLTEKNAIKSFLMKNFKEKLENQIENENLIEKNSDNLQCKQDVKFGDEKSDVININTLDINTTTNENLEKKNSIDFFSTKNIQEPIDDLSTSSFFLKCYQKNIPEQTDTKYVRPATPDLYKPSCSNISKIELILPQANTSINSDDSYSSTTELESILKENGINKNDQTSSSIYENIGETIQTTSAISDYEYALQLAKIEFGNGLQKCVECGKEVLDMVTHMDYHIAFKISQEQRDEFRMKHKQNFSPTILNKEIKTLNKKRKKNSNGVENKEKKNKTIIAFLNKT